jgi:hypothetical protein
MAVSTIHEMHRLGGAQNRPMQLDLEEVPQLLGDHKLFLLLMQVHIFAVLSQLDGVPSVRLLD